MAKDPYPMHGPRRRWFRPWRLICRCGLDAYPCVVLRTHAFYRERVNAAKAWRDAERRNSRWQE